MNSDKISEILEQQLKTLGQKIRIDILKKLKNCGIPISFSMLQKKVLGTNPNSKNFSFHLNTLKKSDLIASNEAGYSVTILGKQILKNILNIEHILIDQNKSIMIRTSKYSKELFDEKKIEDYLIKEGELEKYLAKRIAQEVRERLSKTNIEYLTAPLMREYINAVLLENGLEQVRRKLTRLGTPPYEVFKLIKNNKFNPESFIKKLGYDVSEQFLLLNLLPNELADLYLSGEIVLIHLNYWGLRPLSIYLNADTILNLISKYYSKNNKKIKNARDLTNLILNFLDLINQFKPYFSEDLLIGDFNNKFLSLFDICKNEKISHFIDILISQIIRYNEKFENLKRPLSLEFCYDENESNIDQNSNLYLIDKLFFKALEKSARSNEDQANPLILFDYSHLNQSNSNNLFMEVINSVLKKDVIFYNHKSSNLINSTIVKVHNFNNLNFKNNQMILDKILINLHSISLEANQNDELFYEFLQEKLHSVFELFIYKESLINKKLSSLKSWKRLLSDIKVKNVDDLIKNSLKSISFFGLNEAIKVHCGIELDRLEASESFALKILSFLNQLIEEKNENENEYYILSQPHDGKYLINSLNNGTNKIEKLDKYSSRIIRRNSNLSLNKQISIFKKFEKIIEGGSKFDISNDSNEITSGEYIKILLESKLSAFSIN